MHINNNIRYTIVYKTKKIIINLVLLIEFIQKHRKSYSTKIIIPDLITRTVPMLMRYLILAFTLSSFTHLNTYTFGELFNHKLTAMHNGI